MASKIRMHILCEDQARMGFLDKKFSGQHGFSVFIKAEKNLLFDTGPSDVILYNARLAGVDLTSTDCIVLSHGHWDHTDGLPHLAKAGIRPRVVCHPAIFRDRRRPSGEFNGCGMDRQSAAREFDLVESSGPMELCRDVWFLGEIPRVTDFENRNTSFFHMQDGQKQPDYLPDDTALAIRTDKGVVVVTGCSHAGVCNICEHAMEVCEDGRLRMVFGGFHLLDSGEVVRRTIEYFKSKNVDALSPCHCTALPALAAFHQTFGIAKWSSGDVVEIQ